MKQAYLIIAHGNYCQLKKLVSYLDNKNTDIFIHINLLVQMPNVKEIKDSAKLSNVYFTDRVELFWGGYGLLKSMLIALRKAVNTQKYDYYHVISGIDLPIKSKKI